MRKRSVDSGSGRSRFLMSVRVVEDYGRAPAVYGALVGLIGASVPAILFDFLPLKMAIPLGGAGLIVVATGRKALKPWRLWVIVALSLSAVGDFFMSNLSAGGDRFLLIGTGFYLFVHIAYTIASLCRGTLRREVLFAAGVIIGGLSLAAFVPAIDSVVIQAAVIAYTVVSVVSLAAAAGVRPRGRSRVRFVTAISFIVVSDIAIAFKLFLGSPVFDAVILPAYFASNVIFLWEATGTSPSSAG